MRGRGEGAPRLAGGDGQLPLHGRVEATGEGDRSRLADHHADAAALRDDDVEAAVARRGAVLDDVAIDPDDRIAGADCEAVTERVVAAYCG